MTTEGSIPVTYKKRPSSDGIRRQVVRHIVPAGNRLAEAGSVIDFLQASAAQTVKGQREAEVKAELAVALAQLESNFNNESKKEHSMQNPPPIPFIPTPKEADKDAEIEVEPALVIPTSTRPTYKGSRPGKRSVRHLLRQGETAAN